MAGRNVGQIEITVEPNTSRLKAQIVAATKEAASAAEETEIDLTAEIHAALNTREIAELRKQIQAQLLGIEFEPKLDLTEAREDLIALREQAEADKLQLSAVLREQDLDRIATRVREFTEEQRRIFFDTDVDLTEVHERIEAMEREEHRIEIEAEIDTRLARAKLERFYSEMAARQAKIDIEAIIEFNRAEAALQAFEERVRREEMLLDVGVDLTGARNGLRELEARAKFARVDLSVGADISSAVTSVEALQAELEHNKIDLSVAANIRRAEATIAAFRLLQERDDIEIDTTVDVDHLEAQFKKGVADAELQGRLAGNSFTKAFGEGFDLLPSEITEWVPLIIAALEPAAVALTGLAGGAIQVVSSAFSALAGTAGALLPILAGMGGVLGAIAIGSIGVGKGFSAVSKEFASAAEEGRAFNIEAEGIQKAMGALGPAAQDVVRAFADLFPLLQRIQNAVAEHLFAGLDAELAKLSAETIPDIGTALEAAADVANRFFKGLGDAAAEIDFAGLFRAIAPALDSLGRAITNVFSTLAPFFEAAAPAARELAGMIERASAALLRLVNAGRDSGAITRFLDEGLDSLREWGALIGNVVQALFHLFEAGKRGGDSLVGSLSKAVATFDDWIQSAEGAEAIATFFNESRRILKDLVPLLQGAGEFFAKLITPDAIERTKELASSLGDLLSSLGDFVNTMGAHLTPLISTFASAIGGLADAFDALPGPLQNVLLAFGTLVLFGGPITKFATGIKSAFASIQASIALLPQAVGAAVVALKQLFSGQFSAGLSGLASSMAPIVKGIGAATGVVLASSLGVAFGIQMATEADDLAGQVTGAMSVVGSAITAFFAGGGGLTGGILAGLSLALGGVISLFQKSAAEAEKAKRKVEEFTNALKDIGPAADVESAVGKMLDDILDKGPGVGKALKRVDFDINKFVQGVVDGTTTGTQSVVEMIEKIPGVGEEAARLLRSGEVDLSTFFEAITGQMTSQLAGVQSPLGDLGDQFNAVLKAMGISAEDFVAALQLVQSEGDATDGAMGKLRLRADLLGESFLTTEGKTRAMNAATGDLGALMGGTIAPVTEATEGIDQFGAGADEAAKAALSLAEATKKMVDALKLTRGLNELFSVFSQMEIRGDALSDIFELGNAPAKAAGAVRDINVALSDLGEVMDGDTDKVKDLNDRIAALQAKKHQVPISIDDKVSAKIAKVDAEITALTAERATATDKRIAKIDRRIATLTAKKNQIPLDVDTKGASDKISKIDSQIAELTERKAAAGVSKITVGDIFDIKTGDIRNTVKADEFLDGIDDIRGQIQERIVAAFEGGGAEAAEATAAEWRTTLFNTLKKRGFTQAQIDKLFPELKDIKAVLKPAVDRAALQTALKELELVTGLTGDTPLSMTIGIALETGALSGEAGLAVANLLALQANPLIPVDLLPKVSLEAQNEAREFIRSLSPELLVNFKFPPPEKTADDMRDSIGVQPVGIQISAEWATPEQAIMNAVDDTQRMIDAVDPTALPAVPLSATLATPEVAIMNAVDDAQRAIDAVDPVVLPTIPVTVTLDLGKFAPQGEAAGELGGLLAPSGSFATEVKIGVGIDDTEFNNDVKSIEGVLGGLTQTSNKIAIDATLPTEDLEGFVGQIESIDAAEPKVEVTIENYQGSKDKLDELLNTATDLSDMTIDPMVTMPGMTTALSNTDSLTTKLDTLDGKTIDIFVRQHMQEAFATGGIVGVGGGVGGEAGPELAFFRGVAKIINTPTQLQPGTVVVPLSKQQGTAPPMITRQVNNYMTVSTQVADPVAVAEQVINRAAALATR